MEQFKIILNTAPEEFELAAELPEIPVLQPINDCFIKQKHDGVWNKVHSLIADVLKSAQKVMGILDNGYNYYPSVEFPIESPGFVLISNSATISEELETMCSNISGITKVFCGIPLVDTLVSIQNEISGTRNKLLKTHEAEVYESGSGLQKLSENAIQKMLVVIQNVYKKYRATADAVPEESEVGLKKDHLSTFVIKDLSNDFDILEMKSILNLIHNVVGNIKLPTTIVSQIIPVLEQVMLLYEYFITQQVSAYRVTCKMSSILLNVFIELSTKVKRFCK